MSETVVSKIPTVSPIFGLAKRFDIEPGKLVDVLRGTVIKPDKNGKAATNEEVAAFCIVAQQYGLNPFTREIHAFASGDKGIVPIVGIDGWTHIVNDSPGFDGCEFEEQQDEQGRPVTITCKMFVKGRSHPVAVTERYAECKRGTIPWNTMPWRMLRHKAYMQAARLAFGLSGIYDEDEARDIIRVEQKESRVDPLSRNAAIEEKLRDTKPAFKPEPPSPDQNPSEEPPPLADGEIPNEDTPGEMTDEEKAAIADQEAAEAKPEPQESPLTKEQLIPKILVELVRIKKPKAEGYACGIVGKVKFTQCKDGELAYILKTLAAQ